MNKDSIILFHAEWCPHSQKFMPIWLEFKKYIIKEMPNLRIVDYEMNNVELKEYDVVGFPTVLFIRSDGRSMEFENERILENLIHFVKINMTQLICDSIADNKFDEFLSIKIEI